MESFLEFIFLMPKTVSGRMKLCCCCRIYWVIEEDLIGLLNRHFKDAQLTKNVTKAPAVTTIQNNRHSKVKQQTTLSSGALGTR